LEDSIVTGRGFHDETAFDLGFVVGRRVVSDSGRGGADASDIGRSRGSGGCRVADVVVFCRRK